MMTVFLAGCLGITEMAEEEAQPEDEQTQEVNADTVLDNRLYNEAIGGLNLDKCDQISDTVRAGECKKVVESLSLKKKAVENLDKLICENIELDRYKEDCESTVDGLIDKAEVEKEALKKAEEMRERMLEIEEEAYKGGDASLCDDIEDENKKYSCKFNVVIDKAVEEKDSSLCEEIGHETYIQECKSMIATEE